jgi:hypothetical protein
MSIRCFCSLFPRAAVALVLTEWFFAPPDDLSGFRIHDFFKVAVLLPINNLNLLHPATGFPVEIIAGETLHDGLPLSTALEFVTKAGVQSHCVRDVHLKWPCCLLAPDPDQLQERSPHALILAYGNAAYWRRCHSRGAGGVR